jgi:hypothetical protein
MRFLSALAAFMDGTAMASPLILPNDAQQQTVEDADVLDFSRASSAPVTKIDVTYYFGEDVSETTLGCRYNAECPKGYSCVRVQSLQAAPVAHITCYQSC